MESFIFCAVVLTRSFPRNHCCLGGKSIFLLTHFWSIFVIMWKLFNWSALHCKPFNCLLHDSDIVSYFFEILRAIISRIFAKLGSGLAEFLLSVHKLCSGPYIVNFDKVYNYREDIMRILCNCFFQNCEAKTCSKLIEKILRQWVCFVSNQHWR